MLLAGIVMLNGFTFLLSVAGDSSNMKSPSRCSPKTTERRVRIVIILGKGAIAGEMVGIL